MKKGLFLLLTFFLLSGSSVMSQTANLWFDINENYSQRDTSFFISVRCDAFFKDVKAMRLDIDVNPSVLSFDTSDADIGDTIIVKPGALFTNIDTVTFFEHYLHPDSTRITLDIALLTDSATISGPGQLMIIPITTVGFGESDIIIANAFLIDRFGQSIPVNVTHSWAKVCQFVGDVNADNRIDIADLVYFVDWSFGTPTGPAPLPEVAADVDCSLEINIADIVYLVNYMFHNGPELCDYCL